MGVSCVLEVEGGRKEMEGDTHVDVEFPVEALVYPQPPRKLAIRQ